MEEAIEATLNGKFFDRVRWDEAHNRFLLIGATLCSPFHSATSKDHREARKFGSPAFESFRGDHSRISRKCQQKKQQASTTNNASDIDSIEFDPHRRITLCR
jgi:hypothetical protein